MWPIGGDERHRDALAPGDLILIYLPPPADELIGQAELASAVHDWTSAEAVACPGDAPGGVLLSHAEEWDPPVAMASVLLRVDPEASNLYFQANAKAGFRTGVIRITPHEYETVLAVWAEGLARPSNLGTLRDAPEHRRPTSASRGSTSIASEHRDPYGRSRQQRRRRTWDGSSQSVLGAHMASPVTRPAWADRSAYPAGADPPGPGRGVIAMAMGWSTALIGVRAVLVAVRIGVTVPRPRLTGGLAT
jgi:hypothetical protein